MGLFKNVKQMKEAVAGAPDLVQQAQQLQAAAGQAQAAALQQQAMAAGAGPAMAPPATATPSEADLAPIAGVTLELYAEISKSLAEVSYDLAKAPELAGARGIAAADWQVAVEGWNQRMQASPAVAQQFNRLYTGR